MPARDEAGRIEATLAEYARSFDDAEILVVANGCSDDTAARVRRIAETCENVRCIEIARPVGKGGAVRAGFFAASAPIVGFTDADGATPARELRRLFDGLGDADALIGSRWLRGSRVVVAQPLVRRIASRVFNALVRAFFLLPFSDTQCGAKVFRLEALQRVVSQLETANMAFDVELLLALRDRGLCVREAPIEWRDVDSTTIALVPTSLRMLAAISRVRLRRSFFRLLIPLFDRLFPTTPMRAHDGFDILVLNWRDPTHPQAGGAETYLHEMAKRWLARGHRVSWLTAGYRGASRTCVLDGIEMTRVGNALTVYALLPIAYLRHFRDRFDVIIDAENGVPFFSPFFSLKPKICVMHHVHQEVFRRHLRFPLSTVLAWAERWLMPRVYRRTQFVAVSEDTRREMERLRMSARQIEVVHNGVDAALAPGAKAPVPELLYLGRIKAYKRIDLLVGAFAHVRAAIPEAVLRIAGAGDERVVARLIALVEEHDLTSSVIFEGRVSEERKRELLQRAWLCASASEMEGWGISVIEAAACGTPTVAFAVPGLREAIVDGVTGVLVSDGGDMAAAIVGLLRDDARRTRLAQNAVERARTFSWDASAEKMLDVIACEAIGGQYGLVRDSRGWTLRGAGIAAALDVLR